MLQSIKCEIGRSVKKWHRVSLYFEGPQTSELAADNPFLNYRLNEFFKWRQDLYSAGILCCGWKMLRKVVPVVEMYG